MHFLGGIRGTQVRILPFTIPISGLDYGAHVEDNRLVLHILRLIHPDGFPLARHSSFVVLVLVAGVELVLGAAMGDRGDENRADGNGCVDISLGGVWRQPCF